MIRTDGITLDRLLTTAPLTRPSAWSGNKGSVLGGSSLYGGRGVDFWTQLKTTTALWRAEDAISDKATVAMPTLN